MVTTETVWDALAEIPDPEIPVISLVDLGVIRDVAVEGDHVRVEFTPTFLGCPALEVMREAMAAKVRELGGEPEVTVIADDSWSTDRITPAGRGEAARVGLRATRSARRRSADARPAPVGRVSLSVLRFHRHAAREHLRADAVPVGALLRELPPAVRAVQDDLSRSLRGPERLIRFRKNYRQDGITLP